VSGDRYVMDSLFSEADMSPSPAGDPARFGGRWRLVGAGLSNVWRYGDLDLATPSGRLLLRGSNGTGKTTALEALWPYLLDLNQQRLNAGKARTTTLRSLMKDGAAGKRRYGYVWLTFAGPGSEGCHSFGVRLQYSEGSSPAVRVVPFTVPGAPLSDFPLHGPDRGPLSREEFEALIAGRGGQTFDPDGGDEDYVADLAARVWDTGPPQLRDLADRIRLVRNPSLLGDVGPANAAEMLREALPGVADDVISATADALAGSEDTREAFARDQSAAEVLADFTVVWVGHVTDIVSGALSDALKARDAITAAQAEIDQLTDDQQAAASATKTAEGVLSRLVDQHDSLKAQVAALERSDIFKAAGALVALEGKHRAELGRAADISRFLLNMAADVRRDTDSLIARAKHVGEDLSGAVAMAAAADARAAEEQPLLTWSTRPQAVLTVAEDIVDAGPVLSLHADEDRLLTVARRWTEMSRAHRARSADATLALSDYTAAVRPAVEEQSRTAKVTADAETTADQAARSERHAAGEARTAATALLDRLTAWPIAPHGLYQPATHADPLDTADTADAPELWTAADIEDLRAAEPGQVLRQVTDWRSATVIRAAGVIAAARLHEKSLRAEAARLEEDAAALRDEAAGLRSGRMIPLPRPSWWDGDDDAAFAAALDWQDGFDDSHARALVEAALGASGLLAATLTEDGVTTSAWHVQPVGPEVEGNLTTVITVDPAHRLAAAARAVLARVPLRGSVAGDDTAGLVIGADGSFRAGPLTGRAPGADDTAALPAARHIGAALRRAAARARAAELDAQAAVLEQQAGYRRAEADLMDERCTAIAEHRDGFPATGTLTAREGERAAAARTAAGLRAAADEARDVAGKAADTAHTARTRWAARTAARQLPADTDMLTGLEAQAASAADELAGAAGQLTDRAARQLKALLAEGTQLTTKRESLPALYGSAVNAHRTAAGTAEEIRTQQEAIGDDPQTILAKHRTATAERDDVAWKIDPARAEAQRADREQARLGGLVEAAWTNQQSLRPAADSRRAELQEILTAPGVSDVVSDDPGRDLTGEEELLDAVGRLIEGRRTYTRKTLRERYDDARARLAGTWTLDPAESHGPSDALDTYILTNHDIPYTLPAAARRAVELKVKAEEALAAAEEQALRDFVVGRLPAAIGRAWTELNDWVRAVNRKMQAASASSGVGVQVRVRLADDLAPTVRTVHDLACRTDAASRSREDQATIGRALQQLIEASDADSMHDRVAAAVNIRDWVDVRYEIIRDGTAERWSPRTPLSGGERRLVVLAPVLAAVAAFYDGLSPTGLRLAAIDEVPAEVDERGREGLARYIAALDLDLVCTSFQWDGAPGAWDGIDAWDLESASDGTVVADPMWIRGQQDLPGDPDVDPVS